MRLDWWSAVKVANFIGHEQSLMSSLNTILDTKKLQLKIQLNKDLDMSFGPRNRELLILTY